MTPRPHLPILNFILNLAVALVVTGCAAQYTEPALLETHPASAKAAASPMPVRSGTLDLSKADPITAPPTPAAMHDAASPQAHEQPMHAAPDSNAAAAALYTCPMHPEVISKEPARCPKCNMKLVPKKNEGPNE